MPAKADRLQAASYRLSFNVKLANTHGAEANLYELTPVSDFSGTGCPRTVSEHGQIRALHQPFHLLKQPRHYNKHIDLMVR